MERDPRNLPLGLIGQSLQRHSNKNQDGGGTGHAPHTCLQTGVCPALQPSCLFNHDLAAKLGWHCRQWQRGGMDAGMLGWGDKDLKEGLTRLCSGKAEQLFAILAELYFRVTPAGRGRAPSWDIRAVAIASGVMCLPARQDSCVPATPVTASGLSKSLVLVPEGARSVSAEGVYLSVLGKTFRPFPG